MLIAAKQNLLLSDHRIVTMLFGALAALIGLIVLIGWHAHILELVQLRPALVPMQYNTALCFFLNGIALFGLASGHLSIARALSFLAMLIASVTLAEYVAGSNLGIDELFMNAYLTPQSRYPGRMASSTATLFLLNGIAIFIAAKTSRSLGAIQVSGMLSAVSLAVCIATLIGYVGDIAPLIGWWDHTRMAPHTAVGHVLLSTAIIQWTTFHVLRDRFYGLRLMGFFAFSILILVSLQVWNGLLVMEDQRRRLSLLDEAQWFQSRIETRFSDRISAISRMGQRWKIANGTSYQLWEADASMYLHDLPGIKAIAWRDAQDVLRWVVPFGKRDVVWQHGMDPPQIRAASSNTAFDAQSVVIGEPITTSKFDNGIFIYYPLFRDNQYDGYLVALVSIEGLLTDLLLNHPGHGALTVHLRDILLFATETAHINEANINWVELPVAIGNNVLRLRIGHQLTARASTPLPWVILGSGIAAASLTLTVFWLWSAASQRAHKLVVAHRAVSAQADRIRAIVDNAIDGIITMDESGTITSFNPSAERMFGYPLNEIAGLNISLLVPEFDPGSNCQNTVLDTERYRYRRELKGKHKSGLSFPIDFALNLMVQDEQKNIAAIVRDITEQKKVERMKSEFVATVSHELRTPLTAINGSLAVLATKDVVSLASPARDLVQIAFRNTERLTRLVNDILDFEKIASGHMQFELNSQPIMLLVELALRANESYAQANGTQLSLIRRVETGRVNVDPDRLQQVFANLLSNAVKFSPPQSVISIAVDYFEEGFRISVHNQGSGIPHEFREDVFKKFAQAERVNTRSQRGTGLGLAISKEIVEHLHGRINYESEPGQGATFFVYLPRIETVVAQTVTSAALDEVS